MLSIFTRLPWIHRALIAIFSALIVFALLFLPSPETLQSNPDRLQVGRHYPLAINKEALSPGTTILPSAILRWEKYQVRSGESAAVLFQRIGLTARQLYNLTSSNDDINKQLSRLRPGDELQFGFNEDNELVQLKRQLTP